jgi:hypothetical protein
MLRLSIAVVTVAIFSAATPVHAQWFGTSKGENSAWQRYWAGCRANNSWPAQWVGYDRAAVCTPLSIQAEKGWHRTNLLGSYHFDANTNQLNHAGESKIRFILTHQIPERRTIFVERSLSNDVTAVRVDAAQQAAVAMLPAGELPAVAESNLILEGWPAEDVEATLRGFSKSRPSPRLPAASTEASAIGENTN